MDVIIPLANRSLDNFIDLRFALRSLCLYNKIDRVILVGGEPSWYCGDHLPFPDYPAQYKEQNLRDKTLAGSEIVKGEFLYSNDDFFLLAPYAGAHNKGLLSETIRTRNPQGSYTRCLQNTLDVFGDVVNADTHCPLMMNTDGFQKLIFKWPDYGYGIKTTYCQMNKIETTFYSDLKTDRVPLDLTRLYFSTNNAFRDYKRLGELFTEKSIFER